MRCTAVIALAVLIVAGGLMLLNKVTRTPAGGSLQVEQSSGRVSCLGRIVPGDKLINVTGPYSLYGPAIVSELLVKRGEKVRRGAILAKLQTFRLIEEQLAQAEAEAKVSERLLEQVKAGEKAGTIAAHEALSLKYEAEMKNATVLLARDTQLLAERAISATAFDRTELDWRIAQKNYEQATNTLQSLKEVREVDVEVADARLKAAQATVRRIKAELDQALIRAPIDGVVLEILTYPGEALDKLPLLEMGDLENLRVAAEVYVTDIAQIRPGAKAIITGQGVDGEVSGTVIEVALQVDHSAIFNPDPATFSDKRIVKAWIKPAETKKIAGLVNHQVNVLILR